MGPTRLPALHRRRSTSSARRGLAAVALTGVVGALAVPAVQAAPAIGWSRPRVAVPQPSVGTGGTASAALPAAVDRRVLARITGVDTGSCGGKAMASWKSFVGTTPSTINDNINGASWATISDPSYVLGCWGAAVKRGAVPVYSVPLLPTTRPVTSSLKQGAAGAYDQYFRTLGTRLIAGGEASAVLRLGWEFNGSWQTWHAAADPKSFVAFFRREATLLHKLPGSKLKIQWDVTAGYAETDARTVYPGNDVVDMIGVDAYDGGYIPDSYPIPAQASAADKLRRWTNAWVETKSGFNGLDSWARFARAHHKTIAVAEWGLERSAGKGGEPHGGGDDPYYITQMRQWLAVNNVSYASYFNRHANYDSLLDPRPSSHGLVTVFPLARPVFQRLFSAKGQRTLPHKSRG